MSQSRVSRSKRVAREPAAADADAVPTCIICAEQITYSSVAPCNNVTCHVCSFRQRALFKKKTCLVCRTDHDDVIFVDAALEAARFDDYVAASRPLFSQQYSIHFTAEAVRERTLQLLDLACGVCQATFPKFGALTEHTRAAHSKQFCEVCAGNKHAFVCELPLYTPKQLQNHQSHGDKEGFKGHPKCKFCRNKRFFSEDELNIHIRDHHERCHICTQDNYNVADYYKNYDDLYTHFRTLHYVCAMPVCVEKRFVVFREDLDLTAHMLKEHGGIAGSNGRVVIGTSSHLHSQLSTFAPRAQGGAQGGPQPDSVGVKKRRFEERAKHYLNNDAAKMARFTTLNARFKARSISASDLVSQYKTLFQDNKDSDISLLVYELMELHPQHSEQRSQLQNAYDSLQRAFASSPAQSFPILPGSQSTFVNSSWGNNLGSSRKSQDELFPALAKPQKKPAQVKNAPIRYTTIQKPLAAPKPLVVSSGFKQNASYKPTYLEAKSASPSMQMGASSSRTSSASTSRTQSPAAKPLSDMKFPALEKKKPKPIPLVNPVRPASGWGSGLVASPAKQDDWGIPIIDKKAEKLKRKGQRKG